MTDETPREYDREYCRPLAGPLQVRVGFDREKDTVTRFVVQLEYHHGGAWRPVVRYDHDGTGSDHSHDVTEEGLHIDIYRDGEKHATEYIAPPPHSGAEALNRVEDHLAENLQRFTNRYEQWHGLTDP